MRGVPPIIDRAGQAVTQAGYDALVAEVERLRAVRGMRILRLPEVESRVGLKKTQVYELVAARRFPAPVKLTERAIGWVEAEIGAYLRALSPPPMPVRRRPIPMQVVAPQERIQVSREFARTERRGRGTRARIKRQFSRLCILPLDQLRGLPSAKEARGSGIYFLWLKSRLVYIGLSTDVARRIGQHRFDWKEFTHATWMQVAVECLESYEAAYITHYQPPLNRKIP